jgi:hypothetical protein
MPLLSTDVHLPGAAGFPPAATGPVSRGTAPARGVDAGCAEMRSCPFCGAPPVWERHPALPSAARLACGDPGCGARPATEYLLHEFATEAAARWNTRVPPAENRRSAPAAGTHPISGGAPR